ncbi:MAG: DUF4363 family protein [Clostridia bacterium]
MNKEWIISVVIVVVIVALNIFTQNYTKEVVSYMDDTLKNLRTDITQEEVEKEMVQEKISQIMAQWEERYQKLAFFIEHDELEKVETQLTALKANIEVEEYTQGVPELDTCIFILNHIKDKFSLQIKNVF